MEELTFTDIIELVQKEGFGMTPKGLAQYSDLMEHFAKGGTVNNFPGYEAMEVIVWLGIGWTEVRDAVLADD